MRGLIIAVIGVFLTLAPSTGRASPYPLSEILDKADADKLAKVKVTTSNELLQQGAATKTRRALARTSGLPAAKLLRWTKMCDLLRINGVGPEMVRLLGAGGVEKVRQLRARKAARLYKRLEKVNKKKKITGNLPSEEQLDDWIKQAKKLKLVLR